MTTPIPHHELASHHELAALRAQTAYTRRATVPALEEVLYLPHPVLDHGFIRVIDYMGDDAAIVQAARVSYGKGTKQASNDAGLIQYLMRHWHTTPFEMCEIKFHIKLPIFVARQWIRHRTANVNEYSARYSMLDKEFYLPKPEHLASQSTINNQGRGETLSSAQAERVLEILKGDAERAYEHYEGLLSGDDAIARELARMNLSLNFYTQWYWKIDLHNLFHFVRLRADHHAQYEIRVYAEVLLNLLERWVPLAFAAFKEYRLGAVQLSAGGWTVIKRLLNGEKVTQESSGLGKREWGELQALLGY
ncbi:MAG: FAD-dependent thymidylate synthase [Holosporales bacterium]|jgi:thymidylate synthase (FAD)